MTECPNCHAILPQPPERFCANCGADLAAMGGAYTPPPGSGAPPPGGVPPAGGGYSPGSGYPPGGYPPGFSPLGSTPWERRDQLGFFNALIETIKQVLSTPTAFFRGMPIVGGIGSPLLFALIVGYVGLVASTVYSAVFNSVLGSSLARMGGGGGEFERFAPLLRGGASVVVNLFFGPVFIVVGMFVVSGILHVVLLALAGGGRGFEATFRVVAYNHVVSLFNLIPACGGLIGLVAGLVLTIIGLSEAHQITRGKAAAAVLIPFLLLCCCCGVGIAVAVGGLAGALGHMR